MFGYRQGPKTESIIGRESEFEGTLKAKESVYIDGELGGKVQVEAEVIVGKDAVVKADIQAESVTIKGKVIGNVDCQRKVELFPSGSLKGNVKASGLTIPEGAFFDAQCRMVPSGKKREAT